MNEERMHMHEEYVISHRNLKKAITKEKMAYGKVMKNFNLASGDQLSSAEQCRKFVPIKEIEAAGPDRLSPKLVKNFGKAMNLFLCKREFPCPCKSGSSGASGNLAKRDRIWALIDIFLDICGGYQSRGVPQQVHTSGIHNDQILLTWITVFAYADDFARRLPVDWKVWKSKPKKVSSTLKCDLKTQRQEHLKRKWQIKLNKQHSLSKTLEGQKPTYAETPRQGKRASRKGSQRIMQQVNILHTSSTGSILTVSRVKLYDAKRNGDNSKEARTRIKTETLQEWQDRWTSGETGRWTARLIPDIQRLALSKARRNGLFPDTVLDGPRPVQRLPVQDETT
ncbi:hypothetical protein J6590_031621 [Homalodisca vitripennis]|nr:hypothetical protein J6590_031621 [Homalodisca vitripennis]